MTKKYESRAIRDQVLIATLSHITFDGWTLKSIEAGAIDSGKDLGWGAEMAKMAFPNGVNQLVDHYVNWIDREMLSELEKLDLSSMRIRDRISTIVRLRLQIMSSYREEVRRLLSYLALPPNNPQAARLTWAVADTMWYAAGDQSSDYNYYTKRVLLASVYSTTILYWLVDESDGFSDTWSYLDRCIDNVMKIPVASSKIKKSFNAIINFCAPIQDANS